MYLMYVDESGDSGLAGSPSRYFALSGLVVHELRWKPCLDAFIQFRRSMKAKFGLRLREEIHAAGMISRPGRGLASLLRIKRNDRLAIIRHFADATAQLTDISIINIVVDKRNKPPGYDVFDLAWKALIQRFENTLRWRNFPGPRNPDERGSLFCDGITDQRLVRLIRQMRQYNPIPNQGWFGAGYRNVPLSNVIEDPNFRDSRHSYFIQAADMAAFLVYQNTLPNGYMRKSGGHNYFQRLKPVLCLKAAPTDPLGVVRL